MAKEKKKSGNNDLIPLQDKKHLGQNETIKTITIPKLISKKLEVLFQIPLSGWGVLFSDFTVMLGI